MNCFHCLYFESHRCRNKKTCPPGMSYVEYTGSTVRQCLEATTEIYQDGYIHCPILESVGCERCMERFGDGSEFEPDEDQNYERKPRWQNENGMRDCGLPKEVESQCCLNRGGMCTLDTADFGDIDRAVSMRGCGFIGVNDRYLLWKYGVPYKEFTCGNCEYYEAGEYSWGVCTNERVKPHPKGVTENGEKRYLESKEYYSGAHACGNFVKRGSKEVAKKQYWTKCGRKFEKSSAASVTGYEIEEDKDGKIIIAQCAACPFLVEVKEGWPNPEHKRWECRAGSQPPNHTTEWTGSLTDKNSIQIHSLDVALMEEIMSYCEAHPALGAAYNTDHLKDCRRTIAVHCISNKTGIAAKKELIAKFFPEKAINDSALVKSLIGKEIRTHYNTGGIVINVSGPHDAYGANSWTINYTKDGKKSKSYCIINSIKVENGIITCDGKPLKIIEQKKVEPCEESQTNTGSDSCAPGIQEDIATSTVDKPTAMTARDSSGTEAESCASCQVNKGACERFQACMKRGLEPEDCLCDDWMGERKEKEMIDKSKLCITPGNECPHFCEHNKGCALLIVTGKALERQLNEFNAVDCSVYQNFKNVQKPAENYAFLPESVTKTDEIVTFDYSIVDEETGAFLQEKANRIMEIRVKSAVALGRELKEAQQKLASHDGGTFISWSESLGLKKSSVYNYINAYNWVVQNLDNIEDINSIQQSLLFAVSKPSARPELQQAVLTGDIKTHKEYKELEQKLRDAEERARKAYEAKNKAEMDFDKLSSESASHIKSNIQKIQDLKQQLDQANHNYNQTKVEEMEQTIAEKEDEIDELRRQLKDKPIEATATRVVEKLPDDVQEYLSSVDTTIHHMQNYAKVNQVLNLVVGLSTEEMQSWAMMMNNRKAVDDDEEFENLELLDTAIQSLQDMMEDYRNGGCE